MTEDLLHFIWKNKLFDSRNLRTASGELIRIKKVGRHNFDAGPDFLEAQLYIGEQLWVGHVEMHLKAKDWELHGHTGDPKYQNVILHVVLNNDYDIGRPTIDLSPFISRSLLLQHRQMMETAAWIPCENNIESASLFYLEQMKDRLVISRLERKIEAIKSHLEDTQNDWSETFYRSLLSQIGTKVNRTGFDSLAKVLPYKLILKYGDHLEDLEALLFGCAGLLIQTKDTYAAQLKERFTFLQKKHDLKIISAVYWNFATMRPANFPTIRLAQLASLFHQKRYDFSDVLKLDKKSLSQKLKNTASTYWDEHYHFGKKSEKSRPKKLGKMAIDLLFINHITPLLYAYGHYLGEFEWKDKAVDFLLDLKPESNSVMKKWTEKGLIIKTAFDSQALLELKTEYCDSKNCLNCSLGTALLRNHHEY